MPNEYAFGNAAPTSLTRGARHVLVFTDPTVRQLHPCVTALRSVEEHGLTFTVFDNVRVQPTDESIRQAIEMAVRTPYEAILAVGR